MNPWAGGTATEIALSWAAAFGLTAVLATVWWLVVSRRGR
jgi:hypothetical protein